MNDCGTWCTVLRQGSSVSSAALTLRVPDPDRNLVGVRLVQDVRIAGRLLDFRRGGDGDWILIMPRPYYQRITAFVAHVRAGRLPGRPIPVVLTCGAIEENARNSRIMTRVLRDHGYDATLHKVADMHNYTAWRDCFDPHLSRLLRRTCS